VVWTDPKNENFNIYGYNLSAKEEFQISANAEVQMKPAIYKDTVVWEDSRHHDSTIYGYTISTGEEFRIPINRYFFPFEYDQYNAVIHNDIVVWKEDFFNNIYAYNLKTSKLYRIAICRDGTCRFSNVPFFDFWRPALYNNIIIWVDCRHGNEDIYGYNLETHQEIKIVTHESSQRSPAIYEDIIVWQDNRNGNWDIYGLRLTPPYEKALNQTRTRVIFLDYIWSFILGSAVLLTVIIGGLSIYYMKKLEIILPPPGKRSVSFKRDNLHFYLFLLGSLFFGAAGVFYILYFGFFSGYLYVAISVIWGFSFFWIKKTPYICIHYNEIMLFQTMAIKPQVITRDTIQKMEIKREPNTNMPEHVEFILTSGKKRKIQFSLVAAREREALVQALEEFMS
jgi:beta propeller repeat protein